MNTREVVAENVVFGTRFNKFYKYEMSGRLEVEDHIGVVSSMKDMLGDPRGVTARVSAV